ncbi:MAG: serine/threonine-protein kinase [Vicinamibacteria bacterium]
MESRGPGARCPSCEAEVDPDQRFCPSCGTSLDVAEHPTGTAPRRRAGAASPSPSPRGSAVRAARAASGAATAERFAPGTVLLDRYRIAGLVGRGGMGEVYQAFDLKLEHPVALKFLPRALERDPERLERLYGEVRLARQVSHPAVCRVWDVGEADGQPFLSMEFVDGENLSSLLRRIGRLPVDKAVDIARQVAAGLAAAHDKGVLHRDLKPSNVMLDGQGKVRLTDFGLAAVDATLTGDDIRSGTPSYMSPEQLLGREVTVRSDIYALGLLLYELFTGRRAFDGHSVAELTRRHRDERPIDPSAIVPELPSPVERTILACLEKAPKKRPPSAGAVLAMLSGQDPLAAAIAAGETPSPELVAAAGEQVVVRPSVAWACLAVVVVAALLTPLARSGRSLLGRVPVERSPAALEDRARDLLARLGHDGPAADAAEGLQGDEEYLKRVARTDKSLTRWEGLRSGEPPVVQFWYRQSPRPIAAYNIAGRVTAGDPPATVSGMAGVRYDLRGRLVGLYVVPPQHEPSAPASAPAPDWAPLFAEARLDPAAFRPVPPEWTPPFFADVRQAWLGSWPSRPDVPLRVEAAAYRGRPVWFHVVNPWTRAERDQPFVPTLGQRASMAVLLAIAFLLLVGGAVLAKRHLRLGRGDRRGASRLARSIFAITMTSWLLQCHHVADPVPQVLATMRGAGLAAVVAGMMWLFYLALEPYVRRERPWTIVSWTRLLDGGLRDAVVWRDILYGAAWGALLALLGDVLERLPPLLGHPEPPPSLGFLDMLVSARVRLGTIVGFSVDSALMSLGLLLLFLFLRLVLRRELPAGVALVLVLAGLSIAQSEASYAVVLPIALVASALVVGILLRLGLVATIAGLWISNVLAATPHSLDVDSWLGAGTAVVVPFVAAVGVYAFREATRRRAVAGPYAPADTASSRSA